MCTYDSTTCRHPRISYHRSIQTHPAQTHPYSACVHTCGRRNPGFGRPCRPPTHCSSPLPNTHRVALQTGPRRRPPPHAGGRPPRRSAGPADIDAGEVVAGSWIIGPMTGTGCGQGPHPHGGGGGGGAQHSGGCIVGLWGGGSHNTRPRCLPALKTSNTPRTPGGAAARPTADSFTPEFSAMLVSAASRTHQ